jgi:hypothetical protein
MQEPHAVNPACRLAWNKHCLLVGNITLPGFLNQDRNQHPDRTDSWCNSMAACKQPQHSDCSLALPCKLKHLFCLPADSADHETAMQAMAAFDPNPPSGIGNTHRCISPGSPPYQQPRNYNLSHGLGIKPPCGEQLHKSCIHPHGKRTGLKDCANAQAVCRYRAVHVAIRCTPHAQA